MSFNVLEYFDKCIPKEVLEYAAERDCPPDVIVKFKPTTESEPYYALSMVDDDIDWVEVVRRRANEVTVAYGYPIKTASQRIALSARYLTAMELPFVPVIPAELPLIHNFRFHHYRLNPWLFTLTKEEDKLDDKGFGSVFVSYMAEQETFELSAMAFNFPEGSYSFKITIEKDLETNSYQAEMLLGECGFGQHLSVSTEELGHLDNTFFEKLYQFCLNYSKLDKEELPHFVKNIEDLIRQKRPFHDILNYFNK